MSLTVQSQVQYMSSTEQFSGTANIANSILHVVSRTVLGYSTSRRQPHSSKHFTYLQTSIVQYYGSVQTITSLFVEEQNISATVLFTVLHAVISPFSVQ